MTLRDQVQSSLGAAYTLGTELTGGGMSRAYVADETALGRRVVVKVLDPELAAGISSERFLREIRTTARLQHPNIVPVLSAGEAAGLPYYTMPFIEGASLRDRMDRGGVEVPQAVAILRDVARALAHAHDHGVVHRDVKPDNVLLSGDAGVVTDFGIAKALSVSRTVGDSPASERLTSMGMSLGTPAYMAPEQAAAADVDARADVYAWGIVAYELLSGAHPFAARTTAQQLITAHMTEVPAPLSARAASVPDAIAGLVDWCLAKDPGARPQSARAVALAMDAAGGAAAVTGGAARRRRRLLVAGIAGAAAMLTVAWLAMRARSADTALDAGIIAVMPFRVASADASLGYLREGMLDLIGAQLVGTPRTADARAVLAAWRKAGGGERADLVRDEALRVAESLGAGRLLQGEIVGTPERITVSAAVYDVSGGGERARGSASGSAASLPVLLDSVIVRLLAIEAGEGEQRAASLARIPLPALQEYLAGQRAYRRGSYRAAADAFARATAIDSTFALAGLALSNAAAWVFDGRGAGGLAIARRYERDLGTRDRIVLDALDAAGAGANEADVLALKEEAVASAPDVAELWYSLGDRYFHFGAALLGEPEAMSRSITAFQRALALDPDFTPALEHLPLLYARNNDSVNARRAYDRLVQDTTTSYYSATRLIFGPDGAQQAAARRALDTLPVAALAYAAYQATWLGDRLELIPDLLASIRRRTATESDRRLAMFGEYLYLLDSGQPSKAVSLMDSHPDYRHDHMMAATFWGGDSAAGASQHAREVARVDAPPAVEGPQLQRWITAVYDLAQYELARADTTHARRVIRALRALRPAEGTPSVRARPQQLAIVLEAQLAAVARHADARPRLESLDSLLALGPRGHRVAATGNLVLSRLWEAAGARDRALVATRRWFGGNGVASNSGHLFATYLRERARLAATVGLRDEALRSYRHYLALRANAEPSLRTHVAEVRRAMERLEAR